MSPFHLPRDLPCSQTLLDKSPYKTQYNRIIVLCIVAEAVPSARPVVWGKVTGQLVAKKKLPDCINFPARITN